MRKKVSSKIENNEFKCQVFDSAVDGVSGGVATIVGAANPVAAAVIIGTAQLFKILCKAIRSFGYNSYDKFIDNVVQDSMKEAGVYSDEVISWCKPQATTALYQLEINIEELIRDRNYVKKMSKQLCDSVNSEDEETLNKVLMIALEIIKNYTISIDDYQRKLLDFCQEIASDNETNKRRIDNSQKKNTHSVSEYKNLSRMIPQRPNETYLEHSKYKEILQLVKTEKRILINSEIGGIGKTTICKKLYYDLRKESPNRVMAWVYYSGKGLMHDLKRDLWYPEEKDDPKWEDKLLHFLQEEISEDAILFIDNMNTLARKEQAYSLLESAKCKIVCTSRSRKFDGFTSVHLSSYEPEECAEIFYRYFSDKRDYKKLNNKNVKTAIESVVKKAGYNTLIIEILAKNAKHNRYGINGLPMFVKVLDEKSFDLEGKIDLGTCSGRPVNSTIVNHLRRIFPMGELTECARGFLYVISCMPDGVIRREVSDWMLFDGNRSDVIDELDRLGWIKWDEDGYYMHPIIKEVIRAVICYPSSSMTHFMTNLMKMTRFSTVLTYELRFEYNSYVENYVGIVKPRWDNFSIDEKYLFCNLNYNVSTHYYVIGHNDKAETHINEVINMAQSIYDECRQSFLQSRKSSKDDKRLDKALTYYRWLDLMISLQKHRGNIYVSKFNSNNPDTSYIDEAIEEYKIVQSYVKNLMNIRDKSLFEKIYSGDIYSDDMFVPRIYYQILAVIGNAYTKKMEYEPYNYDNNVRAKKYITNALNGLKKLIEEIDSQTSSKEKMLRLDNAANTYIYYGNYYCHEKKYMFALRNYTKAKELFSEIKVNDPEMLISFAYEKMAIMHYYLSKKAQDREKYSNHIKESRKNLDEAKKNRLIGIEKKSRRYNMDSLMELEEQINRMDEKYIHRS